MAFFYAHVDSDGNGTSEMRVGEIDRERAAYCPACGGAYAVSMRGQERAIELARTAWAAQHGLTWDEVCLRISGR